MEAQVPIPVLYLHRFHLSREHMDPQLRRCSLVRLVRFIVNNVFYRGGAETFPTPFPPTLYGVLRRDAWIEEWSKAGT